jgi:glycosyltransferase involved in cell wall biosynthesis
MKPVVPAVAGGAERAPQLTVCVIGRNEGRHLARGAASLALLSQAGIDYESVFVDSASSDDSAQVARQLFDTVIVLEADPNLNAGAARNVGTSAARGDWILYLDGDMELLPTIIEPIAALLASGDLRRGLSGHTLNQYDDGDSGRIAYSGNHDGQVCRTFGGAVLLPRLAVLEAGNWPTPLFSFEETELYSRLLPRQVRVIWHDVDFVRHHTPNISNRRKLTGLMWPTGSYLGKKYYGPGQVTRLALANGTFAQFFRVKPWGYLVLAALGATLALLPLAPSAALMLLGAAVLALVAALGFKSFLAYCFWVPQVAFGLNKLEPGFTPKIQTITGARAAGDDAA